MPNLSAESLTVVYPKVEARLYLGNQAMTVVTAQNILGWHEVEKGGIPELLSLFGKHLLLEHNLNNRPLKVGWLKQLAQKHLNNRWKFNGTSISIGKYGNVQGGQHKLLSLLLADYYLSLPGPLGDHWREMHPNGLTMETLVVVGVDEDDFTFQTLNAAKGGNTGETIFRSSLLSSYAPYERKPMAKAADGAIKYVWGRSGAGKDSYTPIRTSEEAYDFLLRHPKILDCVRYLYRLDNPWKVSKDGSSTRPKEEGGKYVPKPISQYLELGIACGLMYLMATSESDPKKYLSRSPIDEKGLNFTLMGKAKEFWSGVAKGIPAVIDAVESLDDSKHGVYASPAEIISVLIKAWQFRGGSTLVAGQIKPDYNEDGKLVVPNLGGIDISSSRVDILDSFQSDPPKGRKGKVPDPTPAELAEVRANKKKEIEQHNQKVEEKFKSGKEKK